MLSACGGSGGANSSVGSAATVVATPAQIAAAGTSTSKTTGTTSSKTTVSLPQCGMANFDADMLAAVNAARAVARTCGSDAMPAVAPLSTQAQLNAAAVRHNTDMTAKLNLSHTGSDGSSMGSRIADAGYKLRTAGENVAWNQKSIADVIDSWLNSPGHCANIMKADVTEFGAACNIASDESWYWTQVFAAPL